MIEFKNVTKNFDGLLALNNVSFTIPSACIFGIVGKSGAGKSTLLRTINRLEEIDEGQILIDGVDITSLKGFLKFILYVYTYLVQILLY